MLKNDADNSGKRLKITSIKVIYIHLRDNRMYPKCKYNLANVIRFV